MLQVSLYELDSDTFETQLVGSFQWDGQRLSVNPPDSRRLRSMLNESVYNFEREVDPKKEPEEWLKALPIMYHGSYLWAGEVKETAGN